MRSRTHFLIYLTVMSIKLCKAWGWLGKWVETCRIKTNILWHLYNCKIYCCTWLYLSPVLCFTCISFAFDWRFFFLYLLWMFWMWVSWQLTQWKPYCSYWLTHCGPETRILVFGVFPLQLWKTDDANLPFNTHVDFTHLITQSIKQQKMVAERGLYKKKGDTTLN
jgi:hypothetical protein